MNVTTGTPEFLSRMGQMNKIRRAARLCNYCCHGHATVTSLCIVVELHAAVNNTNPLSVAMETQGLVSFAL